LPYPPLEHLKLIRAPSPNKTLRQKSTFDRTSPFANYNLSPFADTAVSFCSPRDNRFTSQRNFNPSPVSNAGAVLRQWRIAKDGCY
jgi:hypothetical protein